MNEISPGRVDPNREVSGLDPDNLLGWFNFRLVHGIAYIVPAIALVWGDGPHAQAIHWSVSPWIRELDWRISSPDFNRAKTVCDMVIDGEKLWYGMPQDLPKGYGQIPAYPGHGRRMCIKCLQWHREMLAAFRCAKVFMAQPGRIDDNHSKVRIRRWRQVVEEIEPAATIMSRLDPKFFNSRSETSSYQGDSLIASDDEDSDNRVEETDAEVNPELPDLRMGNGRAADRG